MKAHLATALGLMLGTLFVFTAQAQIDSCFQHEAASVTGRMNIREGPSVSAEKTGVARPGNTYEVLDSKQGGRYCWIKIRDGWMAATARVQPATPTQEPERQIPPIDYGIYKSEGRKVELTLEWIEKKSSYWFSYVVDVVEKILVKPRVLINREEYALKVSIPDNTVTISSKFIQREPADIIAAALIHEACHIYQNARHGQRNRIQVFSDTTEDERECYGVEARALVAISPRQREYAKKLACLAREYNPFFSTDYIIKFVCGMGLGKW